MKHQNSPSEELLPPQPPFGQGEDTGQVPPTLQRLAEPAPWHNELTLPETVP